MLGLQWEHQLHDCCFGLITEKLIQDAGIDKFFSTCSIFTEIAKNLELYDDLSQVEKCHKTTGLTDEQINRIITPLEGIYLIIDHIRTLILQFQMVL